MQINIKKSILLFISIFVLVNVFSYGLLASESENEYFYDDVVNTGKDNGYRDDNLLEPKDPHYGWKLGTFSINGFTSNISDTGEPIFLKNRGDNICVWFKLNQDIDQLNGNEDDSINSDYNGYDYNLEVEKQDFGRGMLIVKHTDYKNHTNTTVYKDYLLGCSKGATTSVGVYEEGDYTICLDYEIKHNPRHIGSVNIVPTYTNYKICFSFKVRNGNCAAFPIDLATGSVLSNESYTQEGFRFDEADSRYLNLKVKQEIFKKGINGWTTSEVFNRGTNAYKEYKDPGIYTLTVENRYTHESSTMKIYVVGNDKILKASIVNKKTVDEVQALIDEGSKIKEDGTIILPATPTPSPIPTTTPTPTSIPSPTSTTVPSTSPETSLETTIVETEVSVAMDKVDEKSEVSNADNRMITCIVILIIAVVLMLIIAKQVKVKLPDNKEVDGETLKNANSTDTSVNEDQVEDLSNTYDDEKGEDE